MKRSISPTAMRESEQRLFDAGAVSSIDMMENAARALAEQITARYGSGHRIYFACGTGGNGGDGYACARMLAKTNDCTIVAPKPPTAVDALENLRRAEDIPLVTSPEGLAAPDIWVDAIFGTGLSRAPGGDYAALIERINADRAWVVAADIPSGLNAATGTAHSPCVRADMTVTFQFAKTGLLLQDGLDACGELIVQDIGFPEAGFAVFDAMLLEDADIRALLPARARNIHKGSCGHLLIVAGSVGMAGAAALCAKAALRSGVGLVSIACVQSIVPILQALVPAAMCIPLEAQNGAISEAALPALLRAINGKQAIVCGCGLSRNASARIVEAVLQSGLPAVIDADALNLLSGNKELCKLLRPHHVLTPHPGEAKRLMENVDTANPVECAHRLSALGATLLLKGAASVITDNDHTYISPSGCCGMARGGSGDILSGILGALLAERSERTPVQTAALASELHGLAGERAQAKYGARCMNAADILEFLPEVFPR